MKRDRRDDEREENSKKHSDAPRNHVYLERFLKRPEIQKTIKDYNMSVVWGGVNENQKGEFEYLTHCSFYWKKNGIPQGFPLSMHQSHEDFIKDANRHFGIREGMPQKMKEVDSPYSW